jgi:hypothetical protein
VKADINFADKGSEFHLEEYKALRAEVLQLLETLRSLERNVIVAIGASWAFLLEKREHVPKWSWFVRVLFAVLGILRARGIVKYFGQFRVYLSRLEEAFGTPQGPAGWQHFTGPFTRKSPGSKISDGTAPFWALLLLMTLAAAIWETVIVPASISSTVPVHQNCTCHPH